MSRMKDWIELCADVHWQEYGGTWGKKAKSGAWFLLRFINLRDAMGDDADHTYCCEVQMVNLPALPDKEIDSALESCGFKRSGDKIVDYENRVISTKSDNYYEQIIVDCLGGYGCYATLDQEAGDHYPDRIRAQARKLADEYMRDENALEEKLDKPANAIGSTLRDFSRGDCLAGLRRYEENETDSKKLVRKLYGMPENPQPIAKQIKQKELSGECWMVQFRGLDACSDCEYRNTDECGGKDIRSTGRNEKGILIGPTGL